MAEEMPQPGSAVGPMPRDERQAAAAACDTGKPVYGGQAVIEGVMMRGRNYAATAVRREDGDIVIRSEPVGGIVARHRWLSKPLLRGVFMLGTSLSMGFRSLRFSADVLTAELADQERTPLDEAELEFEPLPNDGILVRDPATGLEVSSDREPTRERNRRRAVRILRGKVGRHRAGCQNDSSGPATADAATPAPAAGSMPVWSNVAMAVTMVAAVAFIIIVPHLGRKYIVGYMPVFNEYVYQIGGLTVNVGSNVAEGFIRLAFLLAYVWVIGFMPDIRRVFQYHGAEHKTVYGVEAGTELTVRNLRPCSRIHPRCGTNFLFIVIAVKVVLFSFLEWPNPVVRILARLALIPVVASIAYEILRLAGRFRSSFLMRTLVAPGLWMQRLTTREPSDDQIEVAIRAMNETIALETKAAESHA